jgi:hypothetical protein
VSACKNYDPHMATDMTALDDLAKTASDPDSPFHPYQAPFEAAALSLCSQAIRRQPYEHQRVARRELELRPTMASIAESSVKQTAQPDRGIPE